METLDLETVISIFAYPIAIVIIFVSFFVIFRKSISTLIPRAKKAGPAGVTFDPQHPPLSDHQNEDDIDRENKIIDELMNYGDSDLIPEAKQLIEADLAEKGITDDRQKVNILIHHLAATQITLEFEQIYSIIFGSQLRLLKQLNEVAGQGRNREWLEQYFGTVQKAHNYSADWNVDSYMRFLQYRNLVITQNNLCHITDKGRDFLLWIIRAQKSENRAY